MAQPNTVIGYFDAAVRDFPDRTCVDFLGKVYSYTEISDLVDRAVEGLRALGLKKGMRVGICLPNTPYYVVCYYAILKAGGVVVNLNPLYAPRELEHLLNDSEAEIVITLNLKQIYPKVADCLKTTPLRKIIVCAMDEILPPVKGVLFSILKRSEISDFPRDAAHMSFGRMVSMAGTGRREPVDPSDLAVLQYTGGTTGIPKGAMLSHGNIVANTRQLVDWITSAKRGEEKMLGVLPFFHVFAMTVVMNVGIALAAELILLPRFELNQVLATITKKKPTMFPGVPTIYTAINNAPDLSKYDLSSIKTCVSGGAPLPVEVKAEFERLSGCTLVEGYGLSEASPVLCANPFVGANKAGSIGIALGETEIGIFDPAHPDQPLPRGERGEICARGPQVMQGYWNKPDATDATFYGDWLRTGDIGYLDEDGYIFLVDRIKDVILCGGFNVYPRMIEEALYQHPAVAEAIAIGVPDDYRGQAPKAYVTLIPGHEPVSGEELRTFLSDKISRIEMPKTIEIRQTLPKTMVGKLSKKELVEEELAKSA